MIDTKQYADHEGDFGEPQPSTMPCPKCGVDGQHFYRTWDSHCGGYQDYKHQCRACGKSWWVDGIDS